MSIGAMNIDWLKMELLKVKENSHTSTSCFFHARLTLVLGNQIFVCQHKIGSTLQFILAEI